MAFDTSQQRPAEGARARYHAADSDVGRLFRRAFAISVLLVVGIGGWAVLASISGAIVASGTIAVESNRKAVQHLDGGIVAAIPVKDGQIVEAGAVIVRLDGRELSSDQTAVRAEIDAKTRQRSLAAGEREGLAALLEKGLVPKTRVVALDRDIASLDGDLAQLKAKALRIDERISRLEIRAPVRGYVHNLSVHTIGGLIAPNSAVCEIVPAGDGLVIEARLDPSDIDQVRAGQSALVRMTSLNQRTTPALQATVGQVSADLLHDETRKRDYFKARVLLKPGERARLADQALLPGMPAEVLIETSKRSPLDFLLKPLTDQLARTFREE